MEGANPIKEDEMQKELFDCFAKGRLTVAGRLPALAVGPWKEHKDFPGVFLKSLVMPELTEGLLSCHLVRIEARRGIGRHAHGTSLELHEVVGGSGVCLTPEGEIAYLPGSMAILPAKTPHEVRAGENGLWLFAKFITLPA